MCVWNISVQSESIDQISNIFIRCLPGELDDQRWADPLTQVKERDIWEVQMNIRSLNRFNMFNPLKNTMSNTQTPVWIQLSFLAHELALGYFIIFLYPLLSFISWCKCSCMVSPSLSYRRNVNLHIYKFMSFLSIAIGKTIQNCLFFSFFVSFLFIL